MACQIVWTKRAEGNLFKLIEYLKNEWGDNAAKNYFQNLDEVLGLLLTFPELGEIFNAEKKIRGFLITKQTKLFYRLKGEDIVLLSIFDTRMDPDKLKM